MLRITEWKLTGTPPPDLTPAAGLQAFNDMCTALGKVPGIGTVRWFFGSGAIITVGEPANYASADTILTAPAAQAAIARVLGLGYSITGDQFLLDPGQVVPFMQQTAAAAVPSRN